MQPLVHGWRRIARVVFIPVFSLSAVWSGPRSEARLLHAQVGIALDSLLRELERDTTRTLKGVLVERAGRVLAERYFNGDGPDTLHDIRSATKSITSLLAGIAVDRKLIRNLDDPIEKIIPRLRQSAAGAITLRQYLTMRSGLDVDDRDSLAAGNEDRLDASIDWIDFAGHVPQKVAPGSRYVYSSLNAYLTGAVVEQAAHQSLATFANEALFRPLGITSYAWRRGPRDEGVGQGNLRLRLRDFAKFGALVLQHGRYGAEQVVRRAWLDTSLASLVITGRPVDPYADAYGYMWYRKRYVMGNDSVLVHFASGNGGNKIYIIPRDSLVVTITSSAYNTSNGQRRSEQILLGVLSVVHR